MSGARTSYNVRIVASTLLSIVAAASFANYYLDLGWFARSAKGVAIGIGLAGVLYALFVTPTKSEFREHGWWWAKDE